MMDATTLERIVEFTAGPFESLTPLVAPPNHPLERLLLAAHIDNTTVAIYELLGGQPAHFALSDGTKAAVVHSRRYAHLTLALKNLVCDKGLAGDTKERASEAFFLYVLAEGFLRSNDLDLAATAFVRSQLASSYQLMTWEAAPPAMDISGGPVAVLSHFFGVVHELVHLAPGAFATDLQDAPVSDEVILEVVRYRLRTSTLPVDLTSEMELAAQGLSNSYAHLAPEMLRQEVRSDVGAALMMHRALCSHSGLDDGDAVELMVNVYLQIRIRGMLTEAENVVRYATMNRGMYRYDHGQVDLLSHRVAYAASSDLALSTLNMIVSGRRSNADPSDFMLNGVAPVLARMDAELNRVMEGLLAASKDFLQTPPLVGPLGLLLSRPLLLGVQAFCRLAESLCRSSPDLELLAEYRDHGSISRSVVRYPYIGQYQYAVVSDPDESEPFPAALPLHGQIVVFVFRSESARFGPYTRALRAVFRSDIIVGSASVEASADIRAIRHIALRIRKTGRLRVLMEDDGDAQQILDWLISKYAEGGDS